MTNSLTTMSMFVKQLVCITLIPYPQDQLKLPHIVIAHHAGHVVTVVNSDTVSPGMNCDATHCYYAVA